MDVGPHLSSSQHLHGQALLRRALSQGCLQKIWNQARTACRALRQCSCVKVAPAIALLEKNGITFSHSRPRVSNDIPYSESFFHSFRYSGDCLYPRNSFDSVEEAEQWVQSFVGHYNEHHRHRDIRLVTPGQRYRGENAEVLCRRKETMLEGAQTPRSAGSAISCSITR